MKRFQLVISSILKITLLMASAACTKAPSMAATDQLRPAIQSTETAESAAALAEVERDMDTETPGDSVEPQ